MSKINYYLFALLIILGPQTNHLIAWSHNGHKVISEVAYNELSKAKQKALNNILDQFIKNLPRKYKKIYKDQPTSLSKLSKLSVLPDHWKQYRFENLVETLNINDTVIINNLSNQKVNNWHYKSKLALSKTDLNSSSYVHTTEGKLDYVIKQLLENIKKTDNTQAKALGIIFITHLLEDAHQPLHAASRLLPGDTTKNDKGGNGFCLKAKKNNQCNYSLHQYWDSAGGWLKSNNSVKLLANNIKEYYPKKTFDIKNSEQSPEIWLNESYELWPIVYNTKINTMPNKIYQAKARVITTERIALASYRLFELLKKIV